jgi:hypothetical protein
LGGVRKFRQSPVESGILATSKSETEQVDPLLELRDL